MVECHLFGWMNFAEVTNHCDVGSAKSGVFSEK